MMNETNDEFVTIRIFVKGLTFWFPFSFWDEQCRWRVVHMWRFEDENYWRRDNAVTPSGIFRLEPHMSPVVSEEKKKKHCNVFQSCWMNHHSETSVWYEWLADWLTGSFTIWYSLFELMRWIFFLFISSTFEFDRWNDFLTSSLLFPLIIHRSMIKENNNKNNNNNNNNNK